MCVPFIYIFSFPLPPYLPKAHERILSALEITFFPCDREYGDVCCYELAVIIFSFVYTNVKKKIKK